MSSASAAPDAGAAPAKGGKKKLFIIIGAVVLVLVLGGGAAAFVMMKNKAAAEAAEAEEGDGKHTKKAEAKGHAAAVRDPKHAPTFVPLDPFTVNLADRDAERYCQVGITLELADPKHEAAIKAFMPVIRNNVLLLLAHKTASELMQRGGKEKLAKQVQLETARALGIEVEDEDEEEAEAANPPPKKKKKKKGPPPELPVTAVHFSNFIIQ